MPDVDSDLWMEGNLARDARDEALDRVVSNSGDWARRASAAIAALPVGTEGIGEDFRRLISKAVEPPRHHNAWGGVISGLLRRGVLVLTGESSHMKTERSHARKSAMMRRA